MEEEITYFEIPGWGWDCPCGWWNESEEDPAYEELVYCEDCGKGFKPVPG